MASILNADDGVVSGSAGLKSTADSSGVLALQTNGTTAVTVTAAGSVGIGTTTPADALNISTGKKFRATHSASVYQQIFSSSSGNFLNAYGDNFQVSADSGAIYLTTVAAQPIVFQTTNTDRLAILSGGNVGIGTSAPNRLLSLYATQPVFQITNVASGNTQGTIQYQTSGGTDFILDNQGSGTGGNIIFQQAGSERARINSSGNVGIGTSSPAGKFDITGASNGTVNSYLRAYGGTSARANLILDMYTTLAGAEATLRFQRAHTNTLGGTTDVSSGDALGSIYFYGTSRGDGSYNSGGAIQVVVNGAASTYVPADMYIYTNSGSTDRSVSPQLTVNSNGTIRFLSTISVGNATPTTSGAGITFPATQSASSDANTLDDYEEGTFTPTYNAGYGSFTSITYGLQSGKYTKVGNMVSINIYIYTSAVTVGTANTAFTMPGLPFTASADSACSLAKLFSWNFGAVTKPINSSLSGTVIYFFNGAYDDTFSSGNYVFGFQGGTADRHFINLTSTYFV